MDNHFENNIEEINQIITRSKKDKSTTIFRIQKSRRLHINQRNNQITGCNIDTLEGVNMHMLSKDGQLIYGASDRMHLPDVITRLYQSLDNLLKANKGHKVRGEIAITDLPTDVINKADYLDLAEWNVEYYQNILAQIYSELPEEVQSNAHISFHVEGNHSLWLIANSEGGQSQFDDFTMTLTWKLALKNNPWKSVTSTKLLPISQLRSQNLDITQLVCDIVEHFKLLATDNKHISIEKIKPEAVLLNSELASNFFYNLLRSDSTEALKKEYKIHDKAEPGHIEELVCKYGAELSNMIEVPHENAVLRNTSFFNYPDETTEANTRVSRQYSFYDQVVPHFRNIVLNPKKPKNSPELAIDISNINESLEAVKKNLGLSSVLYLAGINKDVMPDDSNWDNLIPVIAIYSDKSGTYTTNVHHLQLSEPNKAEIEFVGQPTRTVFRLESQLPFVVETGSLCIIKSGSKFNVA